MEKHDLEQKFRNQFGRTLRLSRLETGISLREASKRIGVSPTYLSSLECNSDSYIPTDELIRKICGVIKISYKELAPLAAQIDGFKSFEKKLAKDDAINIQLFYQVIREEGISTTEGLEIFKDAVIQRKKK